MKVIFRFNNQGIKSQQLKYGFQKKSSTFNNVKKNKKAKKFDYNLIIFIYLFIIVIKLLKFLRK